MLTWITCRCRFRDIPVSGLLARANGARLLLPVLGHGAGVRVAQRRVQHHQTILPVGRSGGGRGAVRLAGVAIAVDRQAAPDRQPFVMTTDRKRFRHVARRADRRSAAGPDDGLTVPAMIYNERWSSAAATHTAPTTIVVTAPPYNNIVICAAQRDEQWRTLQRRGGFGSHLCNRII